MPYFAAKTACGKEVIYITADKEFKTVKLIVVVDSMWGIGKNNGLLFRLKKDMKFFREQTSGKTVVMGAKTFESFPRGALPNRINVVLDDKNMPRENAVTVPSVEELKRELKKYDTDSVYVIGGASVYSMMLEFCDRAYITKVEADGGAEVFFPDLDAKENWTLETKSAPLEDEGYVITFCEYVNSAPVKFC